MKKVLAMIMMFFFLTGCGMNSAKDAVETYLKQYKTLNSEVLVDLEDVIKRENLNEEQSDTYREILKKQYKDLSYEILEEEYDGDTAYVTTKINVYDLYKAQNDASVYLENNREEFNDNKGNYDVDKFISYKLSKMKDTTSRIDYTIIFTVTKEDDKYVVAQPTENDLLKIHGVYNYDLN